MAQTPRPAATRGSWVSVDAWLTEREEAREAICLPPRPRPVSPAPDEVCYALNPPLPEPPVIDLGPLLSSAGRRA